MNRIDKDEVLKGTIENVVYRNENNDYTVMEIVDGEENLVCAVGVIPMASSYPQLDGKTPWSFTVA